MANLGKFKIDTDDDYLNLATLTGITFEVGTKYFIQVQDAIGALTCCIAENEPTRGGFEFGNNAIFSYTPVSGLNCWVKTETEGGVNLNISN